MAAPATRQRLKLRRLRLEPDARHLASRAYTVDASGQKLYLDGQLVASNTSTTTLGYDSHPLVIGADYNNEVWGLPWNGKIKDVRLWSVARSAADVQSDMTTAVKGTEAGLSGAWLLNDGQGGTIADKTAHANSGVLGQHLNSRPMWTSNSALAFDGANDFVDMGSPADNRLDLKYNSTIEADVRFAALPSGNLATIVSKDAGPGNQNKSICVRRQLRRSRQRPRRTGQQRQRQPIRTCRLQFLDAYARGLVSSRGRQDRLDLRFYVNGSAIS